MLSSASEHRGWKREAPRSATNPEAPKVQWPPVAADGRERDLERSSSATIFHRPKLMSTTLTCAEASDGQRGVHFAAANRREISQSRRLPSGLALRSSHDDYLPLTYHRTRGAPLLERAKAPGTGPTPREPPRPGAHAGPLVGRGYPGTPGAPLCGEHSPPRDRLRGDGPPPLGAARCAPSTSQISTGLVLLARARRPLCDPGARRAPDGGVRQRPGATPARRRALRALRHPTPRGKGARQTPRPDHECGWNHRVPRPHGSLPRRLEASTGARAGAGAIRIPAREQDRPSPRVQPAARGLRSRGRGAQRSRPRGAGRRGARGGPGAHQEAGHHAARTCRRAPRLNPLSRVRPRLPGRVPSRRGAEGEGHQPPKRASRLRHQAVRDREGPL